MRVFREEDPMDSGYTVLNNDTLWVDLSCRALGLLVRWLSKPAGVEVDTIPDIITRAKRRGNKRMEGRDALYTASYELEEEGFLVRRLFTNEKGQHEWAAFVRSCPVPPEERSNPDERKRATTKPRKAPAKPESPATAAEQPEQDTPGQASSQVNPIPGNPDSGGPVPGKPDSGEPDSENQASSYQSSLHSSLSPDAPDPGSHSRDGERDSAAQQDEQRLDVAQVLAAYEEALGGPALNGTRAQLLKDADELLAVRPLWWVVDRARELPKYGKSLARHAEMSRAPFTRQSETTAAGSREPCPDHPRRYRRGCPECAMAVPA